MGAIQRPPRPRTDFSYVSTARLISSVAECGSRPNVRLMEELLARGEEWEPGLVAGLNVALADRAEGAERSSNPLWLGVVAGEMRAVRAVPALLRMLRAAPEHDELGCLVAAVALARIGGPAVDGVAELARDGEWWQRIWAYTSLGWNPDPRAGEVLMTALSEEEALLDAVVNAVADRGDASVIPALLEALGTCEPDLRVEFEGAIRTLHHGDPDRPIDRDWRLRYRPSPDTGVVDLGWTGWAVIVREDDGRRPGLVVPPPPVRGLDEILAGGGLPFGVRTDPDGNPVCDCCQAPMWVNTGIRVCPATAMTVAWIQHRWLTRARDQARLDDLFDLLELLEDECEALWEERPRPRTPWDQDEVDRSTEVHWAWRGVWWLIEEGIDDVETGGERIRKEATRLVGLEALTTRARGGGGGGPSLN